jgi:tetratricopeptide (TPR) repeat protein
LRLVFRGRTAESLRHIRQAHELSPLSLIINTGLGYPYLCARRYDEALAEFRKALEIDSNFPPAVYYTGRCLEQRYISAFLIANVHSGLGEKEQALAWLEKAYKERDGLLVLLNVDAHLDSLRSDPRFKDLLRRVGFTS